MFISKSFKILGSAVVPILIFSQTAMAAPSTVFYNNAAGQVVSANYLQALTNAPMKTKLVNDLGVAELANSPIFVTDSNGTTIDYEKAIGNGENYATALANSADAATAPTATAQLGTDGNITAIASTVTVSSVSAVPDTNVANGTSAADAAAKLPTTVTVTLSDNSTKTVGVTWAAPSNYSATTGGTYAFTGTLAAIDGVSNTTNVTATANCRNV